MKRCLLLMIFVACITNGCAQSATVPITTETVDNADEARAVDYEYSECVFADIPDNIADAVENDGEHVVITGYLSSNVSNDLSVGYLWNNGYGTVPTEDNIGKCAVLNLENVDKFQDGSDLQGDNFVTVYGTLVNETWVDVFNVTSKWNIAVDSIEVTEDVPSNVQEYEDYMNSFEWEALAEVIDFTASALYSWQESEATVELDLDSIDCDTTEMQKNTKSSYPELYSTTSGYSDIFIDLYNTVVACMNKKERPDDVDNLMTELQENYEGFSDALVYYGFFE